MTLNLHTVIGGIQILQITHDEMPTILAAFQANSLLVLTILFFRGSYRLNDLKE